MNNCLSQVPVVPPTWSLSLLALPWRTGESGDIISEEDTSRHALPALSVIVVVLRNPALKLLRTCTCTRTHHEYTLYSNHLV